jgi:hypothetical protein
VPTLANGEVDMDAKLPDGTYVHNFSEGSEYFKSKEFKNTSAGKLFTERQAHYLREFSGPGSHSINETLQKGEAYKLRKHPNDFDARMLKNLDQAMKRSTINRKETLYTGLDFKRSLQFNDSNIGDIITYQRFTSTSRDIDQAEKFAESGYRQDVNNKIEKTVLEIEVPSGTHGIDMVPFAELGSYKEKENEILLDRGLSFEVIDKYKKDNTNIIKVKVIKQNQNASYLNEVASFMKLNYNCPAEEKVGSGPGSCSGGNTDSEKYYNNEGTLVSEPVKLEDWTGDVWIKGHKTVGKVLEISGDKANIKWESGKRGLYNINDVKKVVESGHTSTGDFELTLDDKSHEKVLGRIGVMRKRYEKTGELSTPKQRKEYEATKDMTQEEHVNYILEQIRKEVEKKK